MLMTANAVKQKHENAPAHFEMKENTVFADV